MTIDFKNVYVKNTATVAGPIEKRNPLKNYFDKTYNDYYMDKTSVEYSETKMQKDVIDILLKKENLTKDNIDLFIGGDLHNQIAASTYTFDDYNASFLGLYTACATSAEELIVASSFLDSKKANNILCTTSSHNLVSEKQFRNPIEYGALKPSTSTFTATGAATILLTNQKTNIKLTSGTIGRIFNPDISDPNNMGSIMALAAAETIYEHLKSTNTKISDYDAILTGDLGVTGSNILKDYYNEKYNEKLSNHKDCGVLLYDIKNETEVTNGGSGPVCSALVIYSYIYNKLIKKEYKKVLLVATGALFNPTFVYQKNPILSIANAVSLEVAS